MSEALLAESIEGVQTGINTAPMEAFYRFLFDGIPDGFITLWAKGPKNNVTKWYDLQDPNTRGRFIRDAVKFDLMGYDVYVSTCPGAKRKSETERIKAEEVVWVPCFIKDVDTQRTKKDKNVPADIAAVVEAGKALPFQPSAIIGSGNGGHYYHKLDKPIKVESKDDLDRVKKQMRAFSETVSKAMGYPDLDDDASEPARVLRVPGTHNHKTDPGLYVSVIELSEKTYPLKTLTSWCSVVSAPAAVSNQAVGANPKYDHSNIDFLPTVIKEGNRNNSLFSKGRSSRSYGASDQEVEYELSKLNEDCVPPLPLRELHQIIKSVCAVPPGNDLRGKPLSQQTQQRADAPVGDMPPEKKKLAIYSAADTVGMDIKPPPYIINDMLPTGLTTMGAAPKTGKSFMALDMACSIATGKPFFNKQVDQGDVLYLDLEGAQWSVVDRLDKIWGDRPKRLYFTHEAQGIDDGLIDQLEEWCSRDGMQPKMIIVDTLGSVPGHHRRGEDAYQYTTRINQALQRFAINRKMAVLVITHKAKSKGFKAADALEEVTGGMGGVGKSDAVWLISKKRDESEGTLTIISKGREYQEIVVKFDNCVWSVLSPDLQQYRADQEYLTNLTVRAIRLILKDESRDGSWEGTSSQLLDEVIILYGEVSPDYTAKQVGLDVRRFKEKLAFEGIFVSTPRKRQDGKSKNLIRFCNKSNNSPITPITVDTGITVDTPITQSFLTEV